MVNKAKTKPKQVKATAGRARQLDKKQVKAKAKAEAANQIPIPTSFKLLDEVTKFIKLNWKILGGIVLVYSILNLVFAGGLLGSLNDSLTTIRQGQGLSNALSGYGSLLGSSTGGTQTSSATQSVLVLFESLVIIWALRQLMSGQKIGVKQAYYQSMTPLVPFLLVVLTIIIQLLPLTLGSAILGIILSNSLGNSGLVTVIFSVIFIALAAWTIYMISASIFSIYIVTLPDMQPRQALRSAKKLVHFRRWVLLRRLLFLPLIVLLVIGVITTILILIAPILVVPVFFVLLMLSVLFIHSYLYSLYKGLIA